MDNNFSDIVKRFKTADIDISSEQAEKMDKMIFFLQNYCRKVNLTAIRDREGIIEKHLIDSVLPLTLFDVGEEEQCLDIGTGAGFPAVPMMIYREDLRFTLLDAQRKRTDYLDLLMNELGLKAEIIHGRAEELGRQKDYKCRYGMITARAVSDLATLLNYAAPMVKKGGFFAAMRGSKEELSGEISQTCTKQGFAVFDEIAYKLPCGDGRRLILFRRK